MQASLPPMHQFAKPARNKLQSSHRDKEKHSSLATSPQHKIHHQREASVHNLNLFARLSSFSTHGNHSGGSRRIDASNPGGTGHSRRPSRDGLDWYCRGSKYSPDADMAEVSFANTSLKLASMRLVCSIKLHQRLPYIRQSSSFLTVGLTVHF